VRSGTKHRSERVVAQSPTPTSQTVKNENIFCSLACGGNAQIKKISILNKKRACLMMDIDKYISTFAAF